MANKKIKFTAKFLNRKVIYTALFFISFGQSSFAQTLQWAKAMSATTDYFNNSVAVDGTGNVYITGSFKGTADFDPGTAVFELVSAGYEDIFISKLDPSGNFLWAKKIGSTDYDFSYSIAIDASGNIFTTGCFWGTVDFDPDTNIFNLTSSGGFDIFISKLDSSGNFLWAKSIRGTGIVYNYGYSIATDSTGNVYTTGFFTGTADFNPGLDTFNLSSTGGTDIFISKLDSSGNFTWAKNMGSTGNDIGNSLVTDDFGNVYTTGSFSGTVDFDPGTGTFFLTSAGATDIFVSMFDATGNFKWAKGMGGASSDKGTSITTDIGGNVYTTGLFKETSDFDPDTGIFNLTSAAAGTDNTFISKFDSSGNFLWAKAIVGIDGVYSESIAIDIYGNVYTTGTFWETADFDPDTGVFNLSTISYAQDIFISKLSSSGMFFWAIAIGNNSSDYGNSVTTDINGNIYATGYFNGTVNFDPGSGTFNLISSIGQENYILKMSQKGVIGYVFNDINQDCIQNVYEIGLNRNLIITPNNIVVQTNNSGIWKIDSLSAGTYTVIADTSGKWKRTCSVSQNFTVTNPNDVTIAPSFGFVSTEPCAYPDVSIRAPFLRTCFSYQSVYVEACNQITATGVLDSAYVDVQLDTLLTLQSASLAYTDLGNNKFRFNVGTLNPGMCANFTLSCLLSCNAMLGQTLCMQADLYPADSCVFDTISNPFPPGITPCTLPWDKSSLKVEAFCVNDSIHFVVYNTGDSIDGDMDCYAPVRLYIDGQFTLMDSIKLTGGDSIVYVFSGDGRTWRLETDQHPKHPGNSQPNATIEACGNIQNWTPDLVNLLPMNDADPVTDIYCGIVRASYDPNDKTGYPYGVTDSNYIYPNQALQYVIQFQNTGTDTAFTVVIRDTLDENLDIFSVTAGVSSHNYTFQMYGPRVLEWTFNNILLPDSLTNELESHGFVSFKVNQNLDLPSGMLIQNKAGIYFDFNTPVITNQTFHIVNEMLQTPQFATKTLLNKSVCETYTFNGFTYNKNGTYIQNFKSSGGLDSIVTFNLTINNSTSSIVNSSACVNYVAPSGTVFTTSGVYSDTIPNTAGCDSVITINLSIINSSSSSVSASTCVSYTAPSGAVFTTSGLYSDTIPNAAGCDSVITINLSINNSSALIISTDCGKFTTPSGRTLTTSGIYSDTIPNIVGCDSIITINLTINTVDTTVLQNIDTLTANESDGTYQWIDCSSGNIISGEIEQSYTAATNGSYAVIVTKNGCTDTSDCYNVTSFGLIENTFGQRIDVYPNPSEDNFTLDLGKNYSTIKIEITDITGKSVYSQKFKQTQLIKLDLNKPAGIYFLNIYSGKDKAIYRLVNIH